MSLYREISDAIREVIDSSPESVEFKQRFSKLIENYFDNSYQDSDISELIGLVQSMEDSEDGN